MGSWSKNQPGNILLPWIRKYGCTACYVFFCLAVLIFQHRQNFSPREYVFLDRLNTLDRRAGSKFEMAPQYKAAATVPQARVDFQWDPPQCFRRSYPLNRESRLILTLSSRWFVFSDRLNTLDRLPRPKLLRSIGLRPILNLGLLCCWRGAATSVNILASTSSLRAWFRVYEWNFVFGIVWHNAWETWLAPWRLKKRILWWARHIPIVDY